MFRPKTRIIKIKGDWNEVLNDCRFTVGKNDLLKEPSDKFKKQAKFSANILLVFKKMAYIQSHENKTRCSICSKIKAMQT